MGKLPRKKKKAHKKAVLPLIRDLMRQGNWGKVPILNKFIEKGQHEA